MAAMVWGAFGAIWALNEKVSFDGPAKRIRVNQGATVVDVKADLYSAWKRWAQLDDHTKFLPAFRSIGGDTLGGGLFAGDLYFLTNGWQVVIDHPVTVNGVLYHDDSIPVFVIEPGGGATSVVSNLTQTAVSQQNVVTGDLSTLPNADQVAAQVRAELAAELARIIELAKIHGLVEGQPLTVAPTTRQAGDVVQTITEAGGVVTVTRSP